MYIIAAKTTVFLNNLLPSPLNYVKGQEIIAEPTFMNMRIRQVKVAMVIFFSFHFPFFTIFITFAPLKYLLRHVVSNQSNSMTELLPDKKEVIICQRLSTPVRYSDPYKVADSAFPLVSTSCHQTGRCVPSTASTVSAASTGSTVHRSPCPHDRR